MEFSKNVSAVVELWSRKIGVDLGIIIFSKNNEIRSFLISPYERAGNYQSLLLFFEKKTMSKSTRIFRLYKT